MVGQIKQFLISRSLQTSREKKATRRTATRTPRRSLPGDPPLSSTSTPTPSSHSQSRSAPLECFTCPRGGTATPTPPAQDQSPPSPPGIFNVLQEVALQRRSTPHKAPSTLLGKWVPILPTHLPAPITTSQCTKSDRTWCRVGGG